jgi:hypothetical protein
VLGFIMKIIIEIISRIGRGFICGVIGLLVSIAFCFICDISNFRDGGEEHLNAWRFIRIVTLTGFTVGLTTKSWVIGGEKSKHYERAIIGAFIGAFAAIGVAYIAGLCARIITLLENKDNDMASKIADFQEMRFCTAFILFGLPIGILIGVIVGIRRKIKPEKSYDNSVNNGQ